MNLLKGNTVDHDTLLSDVLLDIPAAVGVQESTDSSKTTGNIIILKQYSYRLLCFD
jgi:hypothetical protein